jgi:hypothetical protein
MFLGQEKDCLQKYLCQKEFPLLLVLRLSVYQRDRYTDLPAMQEGASFHKDVGTSDHF